MTLNPLIRNLKLISDFRVFDFKLSSQNLLDKSFENNLTQKVELTIYRHFALGVLRILGFSDEVSIELEDDTIMLKDTYISNYL